MIRVGEIWPPRCVHRVRPSGPLSLVQCWSLIYRGISAEFPRISRKMKSLWNRDKSYFVFIELLRARTHQPVCYGRSVVRKGPSSIIATHSLFLSLLGGSGRNDTSRRCTYMSPRESPVATTNTEILAYVGFSLHPYTTCCGILEDYEGIVNVNVHHYH